jgi:hypothetical protein
MRDKQNEIAKLTVNLFISSPTYSGASGARETQELPTTAATPTIRGGNMSEGI